MAKVQFETTNEAEISICRIKQLVLTNDIEASKKGDYISLGLDWLMTLIDNMPPEQVYSILKIKQ